MYLQVALVISNYVYVIPKSVSGEVSTCIIGQILDITTQDKINQEEFSGFEKVYWDTNIGYKYSMELVCAWE